MPHPCPHHCPKNRRGAGAVLLFLAAAVVAASAHVAVHAAEIALEIAVITAASVLGRARRGGLARAAYAPPPSDRDYNRVITPRGRRPARHSDRLSSAASRHRAVPAGPHRPQRHGR
jgi:hypothetical protein